MSQPMLRNIRNNISLGSSVFFWLIVFLLPASALSQSEAENSNQVIEMKTVLHVALHDLPPWSYRENEQIKGADYDTLHLIAEERGVKLDVKLVPNRRRIALVATGKADLITVALPIDKTTLYPYTLLIDQQPFYQFKIGAVSLKGQLHPITSMADLYSLRVGHLRVPTELENAVLPGHPSRMRFNSALAMLKGLLRGRVHVALTTPAELLFQAEKLGVRNRLHLTYKFTDEAVFSAWSTKGIAATHPEIRKQFHSALKKLRHEGKIASILQKYNQIEYFSDYGTEQLENSLATVITNN